MNNNLEFENENPEPSEDGPRSNYGDGYELPPRPFKDWAKDWSTPGGLKKRALQKAYEELSFLPEDNINSVLSGLAHRFNISVDEVLKNIDL